MNDFFGPKQQQLLDKARADPNYLIQELTPEELTTVERKRKAMAELFKIEKVIATYKIEVNFGKDRSTSGHFPGSIIVFRSGSAFDGGGDEPLFPCPDDRCPGFIPPNLVSSMLRLAVCPKCRRQFKQSELYEMKLFRLTAQDWAKVLARYFIRLGSDADIYMKTHPIDIRVRTHNELARFRGGSTINAARAKRVRVLYSLHSIYKDLSNGAELESRLRAFLVA